MKKLGTLVLLMAASRLEAAPPEFSLKVETPVIHVFDGVPATLNLAVEAPLGANVSLRAEVVQVASGLAAPLAPELKIADAVAFADRTFSIVPASIPLPVVKNKTELRVRFRMETAGREPLFCDAQIFVHPKELPETLKKPPVPLTVFGESPRLRAFLTGQGVPFTDGGDALPSAPRKDVLYLTEIETPPAWPEGMRVVFFSAGLDGLPGVYQRETPPGSVTKVTLPILDNLSTDPLSQEIFARLLASPLPNL